MHPFGTGNQSIKPQQDTVIKGGFPMKIAQRVATGYMKKQGGEWGSFVKVASNEVIEDYI